MNAFIAFLSSGTRIVADVSRAVNDRILSVDVLCSNCTEPQWLPLEPNKSYRVAMADYLALGGSMYDFGNLPNDKVDKLGEYITQLKVLEEEHTSITCGYRKHCGLF